MKNKRPLPTCWQQWIGEFVIVTGRVNGPVVAYVTGFKRSWGALICQAPNKGLLFTAKHWQLSPYAPRMFDRLKAIYKRKEALRQLELVNKELYGKRKS